MKYILNSFIAILFLNFTFVNQSVSQEHADNPMSFNVYRVYPAISFTKDEFSKAKSIIDINDRFKPEWVKNYVSVEITATKNGKSVNALGKTEVLTQDQIQLINSADLNTEIAVSVMYFPDNNLSHNDVQEERFKFYLDHEVDARYAGEQEEMLQYIKQNAIDKIPKGTFGQYQLSAVTFSVNKKGQIVDVNVLLSAENEAVDKFLYDAVCNMGKWRPAEYTDGTKIKQDYVLLVGDMKSCNTNLINIRAEFGFEEEF
jgi:hypothetical protein